MVIPDQSLDSVTESPPRPFYRLLADDEAEPKLVAGAAVPIRGRAQATSRIFADRSIGSRTPRVSAYIVADISTERTTKTGRRASDRQALGQTL